MPRIRSVKHELFEDEALAECSPEGRLLFVGLITWSDDYGNQRAAPALLKSNVFPYDEKIGILHMEQLVDQLWTTKMVDLYEVDGEHFLHIRGWAKHQRIDNAGTPQVPGPEQGKMRDRGNLAANLRDSPRLAAGGEGRGKERKGVTTTSQIKDQRPDKAPPSAEDSPLSHLLADLIAGNDPDGQRPNVTKAWADAERLLQERDGRPAKQIRYVIEWCQGDEFERNVVRSMTKLRKRYPELVGKAKDHYEAEKAGGKGGTKTASRVAELVGRGRAA